MRRRGPGVVARPSFLLAPRVSAAATGLLSGSIFVRVIGLRSRALLSEMRRRLGLVL
jgi:hypothetical protein